MSLALSICIPTYNRVRTLPALIESVFQDGAEGLEVVISDNASTDDTAEVVAEMQKQYPALRYHRNATNIGIDRNFLMAVSLARGEYAILVGSDDGFPKGGIGRILDLTKTKDSDIIVCNRIECDRHLKPFRYRSYADPSLGKTDFDIESDSDIGAYFDFYNSIGGAFTFISSDIFKTSRWQSLSCPEALIGKLYPHLAIFFQMMKQGCRITYTPEHLVLCRLGNDSFSNMSVLQRMEVDLNGFDALAKVLFSDRPEGGSALRRLLVREHTEWGMGNPLTYLSYRSRTPTADWRKLVRRLSEFGPLGRAFQIYDVLTPGWLMTAWLRRALVALRDRLRG